ncbi:MAG: ComEA family DNA-binding protein [Tepidisphaeraceae bacterium]
MLIAILVGLLLYIALRLRFNPVYISDPQPEQPSRAIQLADRIDPNTADWATLAALPMIGEKRARDIIAYRESVTRRDPQAVPFARAEDLLKIRGIGPSMLSHLRPYLIFPSRPRPTTTPTAMRSRTGAHKERPR